MEMTNEEFVRHAYATAEVKDIAAWVACFNPDGAFVDESVAVTYRGPSEVGKPVENYGTAFSDMHGAWTEAGRTRVASAADDPAAASRDVGLRASIPARAVLVA
jgi:hypothetical protein